MIGYVDSPIFGILGTEHSGNPVAMGASVGWRRNSGIECQLITSSGIGSAASLTENINYSETIYYPLEDEFLLLQVNYIIKAEAEFTFFYIRGRPGLETIFTKTWIWFRNTVHIGLVSRTRRTATVMSNTDAHKITFRTIDTALRFAF